MLEKDGKSARPRFHVYFPIEEITDAETYANLKAVLQKVYPFFDDIALDAARFLYGTTTSEDEIVWHEGWMSIIDDIDIEDMPEEDDEFDGDTISGTITQGNRNNTLSRFAGRVLKRYGETDKAHEMLPFDRTM